MAVDMSKLLALGHRAMIDGNSFAFESCTEKFEALAEAWDNERPGSSIINYESFAHHQIIGMGPAVIPLLLDRLRLGEGHWVYALTCIAGEQAHEESMNGDSDRVIQAWLDWGRRLEGTHGRLTA
jgi:hypothetical protein